MKLGQRIKSLREGKGWTYAGLGERVGVSLLTVSKWEHGLSVPTPLDIKALAVLFGVTTSYLERGNEDMVDGKNMIALTTCIKRWVKNRGIDTVHPRDQFIKVVEIAEGLAKKDKQLIIDGVGDAYVTLVALCATLGLEIDECVYQAYKEIENRKGEMVDGVFVKEEDL